MWANNLEAGLGRHTTEEYVPAAYVPYKQEIIAQQRTRSNIIILYIKNSMNTNVKLKLRAFKTSYTYKNKYGGAAIFFSIIKIVYPDTHVGFSDIKINL